MSRSHWGLVLSLVRPHRRAFGAYGLLLASATGLPILGAVLIGRFVDLAVAGAGIRRLAPYGVGYAGTGLAGALVGVLVTWRATALAWKITNGLRHDLASHVLHADLSFHRDHTPGELLTRCDADVTSLTTFLGTVVARLVGIGLLAAVSVVVLSYSDLRLALVLFVGYGLLGWTMWLTKDVSAPAVVAERRIDAEMNSVAEQYLAGADDVAALGAGAHGVGRVADRARDLVEAVAERVRYEMRLQASVKSVTALLGVVVLAIGAVGVTSRWTTVGGVVLAFQLVQVVRRPVEQLTWRLLEAQGVAGAARRVLELVDDRSNVTTGSGVLPAGGLELHFEHTGLVYDDADEGDAALAGLDLRIAPGRVVGLVGRSGSGKTTIARLVLRLVSPTSGRLLIGGRDVTELDDAAYRHRVGAIPQDVQLFPGSVRDNVTMFADADDGAVVDALRDAGLGAWFDGLTDGLDTTLAADHRTSGGDGGEERAGLSAGQAQLLAIARALLRRPDLVVLDEATSRVDPATQAAISEALGRLVHGRTGVLIAHRLETLDECDDIAVLADGELVEFGPRTVLAADSSSRYARLRAVGADAEELQ